jgi:hypothetical protein
MLDMVPWESFVAEAPGIAEVFLRRHAAAGNLCMLATLRSDGSPRISPMEPRITRGQLILVGMPGTLKFRDLARDPRYSLHTATVDPHVGDGDAKLWGGVRDVRDKALHKAFADELFEESGFDLRGQSFDPFYVADIAGASAVTFEEGQLTLTLWKPGEGERTQRLD